MTELLVQSPILQLVVVSTLGYLLGQINIKGSSLGVSAVLFAGLFVGALHPDIALPEFTIVLGLVLFVYTIGLSSGPGFFASFRRKGLRDNILVVGMLLLAAGLTLGTFWLLQLPPAMTAGLFAGSLTNTPALASVLEYLSTYLPPDVAAQMIDDPVVGYSIAYPVGVIGMITTLAVLQRLWKIDYEEEARHLQELASTTRHLENRTVRITRDEATQASISDMMKQHGWDIIFGRIQREKVQLVKANDYLQVGDLVSVIGVPEELNKVTAYLGVETDDHLEADRSEYDYRRIFISHKNVAGKRLSELGLWERFGAIVTRLRRGDVEWVAHGNTVLEPGDRVRVVAHRDIMPAVSSFLGDSYRALSEINLLTFSLGLTAGLLLGMIPVPLPGGITFKLGAAGGPLLAGLVLGKLGRTGPLVWHLPYSGNLILRQFGLVLFFAGVGTRSGHAFFDTITQSGGVQILIAGAIITCSVALTTLWIGYRVLKIPMSLLAGILAGLQTQPAVLSYALEQSGNDLPNIGYATVFPIATITKILFVQILLALLL
jgi:putative transport protein